MTVIELPVRHRASSDTMSAITMTIVKSFDASGISRKEWDDFILDAGGEIYSSYDWCRIWWRHYGNGRNLRLFIFRQQGRLVGLAPMFVERIWLGLLRIRLAKPVGADFAMDVFGLPTLARCPDSLYGQIISELVGTEKCDAVWFGFAPAEHHSLEALRRSVDGTKGSVAVVRDTSAGALTLFDLPNNFDSYVAGLGKAARQNFRRQLNLLKKASSVEQVVIQTPIDPEAEFRAFNELHTRQWEAEGLPGHFKDWPGSEAFNQDLITQHSRLGRLRMVRLHSDEKIVASQYAFTFGSTGYWRLAARATEKELARYGLGVLGLMQLLEQMCRDGIQRVEGGFGRYPYKLVYGAKEQAVTSLLLKSTRPLSSLRAHLFVVLSRLIHLLYYRIWRLRIAPKLPFRSSPLWRSWIRFRI
jgi:CelD/BcsL family acetyltransferase involved in cellulose biosynthesis